MKWVDESYEGMYSGNLDQATKNRALEDAVRHGDIVEVQSLIDAGAQVNPPQPEGSTPFTPASLLHIAASLGRSKVCEILVGNAPEIVKTRDYLDRTALHIAALKGSSDTAHVLVQMGVDPKAVDRYGLTAADIALGRGYLHVVDALIGGGVEVDLNRDIQELKETIDFYYPRHEELGEHTTKVKKRREEGRDFPDIPVR